MHLPLLGLVREDHCMQQAIRDQQALAVANPQSAAARDIDVLVDQLLTGETRVYQREIGSFWHLFLQRAGVTAPAETGVAVAAEPEVTEQGDLQQQIEFLSTRVDELIAEVERLRAPDGGPAALPDVKSVAAREEQVLVTEAWISSMASGSQDVSVHNDTFPVYRISQPDGELLHFAYHSLNDNLQAPESRTTSS
jgi:hypothetical protein